MRGRVPMFASLLAGLIVAGWSGSPLQAAGTCDGHPSTLEGGFPSPLFGTSGPDVIVGTAFDDRIDGGGGDDIICSGGGDDEVFGFNGNDRIFGEGGDDLLNGEEGNDHILGGASGSVYDGEYDLISGEDGDDHLDGEGGGDIVFGVGGADEILGGEGDDALAGDAPGEGGGTDPDGADEINGGEGIESIEGGPGDDILDGGPDGDASSSYRHAPGPVTVDLEAGTATGAEGNDTFTSGIDGVDGSPFADTILGSDGPVPDSIDGAGGKDKLDGRGGNADLLSYNYSEGPVTVDLGEGTSSGGAGKDKVKNFEQLGGSPFADRLTGGPEPDSIEGHEGNDIMDGAGGTDVVNYEASEESVFVSLAGGTGSVGEGQDQLKSFEGVEGSAFDDQLIGNARDNFLDGGPGEDAIYGRNGSDNMGADEGSDLIVGGSGIVDYVFYLLSPQGVVVDLENEVANSGSDEDTLLEIEGVIGSGFVDEIRGDAAENALAGGPGDDLVDGRGARDLLMFIPGIDPSNSTPIPTGPVEASLTAGVSRDLADPTEVDGDSLVSIETVTGTEGNDVLEGSDARDTIIGLGGNDELDGLGDEDSLVGGTGSDDIDGGADFDGALFFDLPAKVVVDLGAGTATSGAETDTLAGTEAILGTDFADTLTGDGDDNILMGWGGKDKLFGEGGDDGLLGPGVAFDDLGIAAGDEQDKLFDGGEGTDSCEGGGDVLRIDCELDELTDEQQDLVGLLIEAIRDIKRKNGVRVN